MTNSEINKALYEKMSVEQEKYRDWLLSQPAEEVLKHTYEYTVREDILVSLEFCKLTDGQAEALLKSPSPLSDVFDEFADRDTGYMDQVCDSVRSRADKVLKREQKKEQRER